MAIRSGVKRLLFGTSGVYRIRIGLLRGLRFHVDPANKSMRLVGLDEAELTASVRRLTAGARSAADVGANDGWYALYFASQPGVERVLAFEPDSGNRDRLAANLAANPGCAAKVDVSGKMVGEHTDATWCRLDDAAPNLPPPVVVKIDVDGGELEVLRGAAGLLTGSNCRVVLEVHSPDLETGAIALLTGYGYRCKVIGNGWYRAFIPEGRQLTHNRWVVATR